MFNKVAVIGFGVLVVATLSCESEPAPLEEAKQLASGMNGLTAMQKRKACENLRKVEFDYQSLSESLPIAQLKAAAFLDSAWDKDVLEFHCDRYWKRPISDIVTRHFSDIARPSIIRSCREWLDYFPYDSWKTFRDSLRVDSTELSPKERSRLIQSGVNFTYATEIYFEFSKNDQKIRHFCESAQDLSEE